MKSHTNRTTHTTRATRISIAAAGAILFAVAPAQAQSPRPTVTTAEPEIRTAIVSSADLNLSSPAGRDRLEMRVRGAVKQVCPTAGRMTAGDWMRVQKCQQAARSNATSQIERIIAAKG